MTIQEVERARKECAKRVCRRGAIVLAATALIWLVMFGWAVNGVETKTINTLDLALAALSFVFFVTVAVAFVTPMWASYGGLKGDYKSAYKAYFVEESLRRIFTDLEYRHEAGLVRSTPGETGMIKLGDVFNSNDLTTGKYKDVSFTQADIHIQKKVETDDGEYYVTVFKGRWMIFEFPRAFRARLEVVEKGFKGSKVAETNGRKFEEIKVESEEFGRMFRVYAEDSVEGYYLLDPATIERLVDIGEKYRGKLLLGFVNNRLHVGLKDGKDAFEPPKNIFRSLDESAEMRKVADEIKIVTDLVDGLRLDKKIFQ